MKAASIFNISATLLTGDPAALAAWYREKFDLRTMPLPKESLESEELTADAVILGYGTEMAGSGLYLMTSDGCDSMEPPSIFFVSDAKKAHEFLTNKGVSVGPLETDSQGTQCFFFHDPSGNRIEVSAEPD